MLISDVMAEKNITIYRLSKNSGIPYATINDICNNKVNLAKCNAETIYRLAKELDVSMEELLEPYVISRPAFGLFKSNVCHSLKELGDIDFLIKTIESNDIITYYQRGWFPECLYLLAMVDYISRINDIPLCSAYNKIRCTKLKTKLYPASIILAYTVSKNDNIKAQAEETAIPEFLRFNIVESEVRNVV